MKTIDHIADFIIPAALNLLPARMDSPEARAILLAIGLQESGFRERVQVRGPARGFWQFEEGGGVRGVLEHDVTKAIILPALDALIYKPDSLACYVAMANNDVLACVFARLLLWSSALPLPKKGDAHGGWMLYLSTWRPGKPNSGIWDANFARAWSIVEKT